MKVIIVGAGFTGFQLAKRLIAEKNDVVLIEKDEEKVKHSQNRLDCMVIQANGNNLSVLKEAGLEKSDALITVTESDELNMIICSLAASLNPNLIKIARVRNFDYYNPNEKHNQNQNSFIGIDFMVHPDIEAANAIVTAVNHGAVSDILEFENSDYEVTRITIEKNSPLDGVCVKNIKQMTSCNFLLAYVEKQNETFMPYGSTILNADDRIGILTSKENVNEFFELCGAEINTIKKIALLGAGRIGTSIAEKLFVTQKVSLFSKILGLHKKISQEFVIIDSNDQLTKEASARFPDINVFKADITDESFVEEEGLKSYDLVIAATHNHELNIVTSAYLKSLGIKHSVCLVSTKNYADIARNIGIDVAVPIKDSVIDSIMSHLRGKTVTGLHTISEGVLEIIEVTLTPNTEVIDKQLHEISEPGNFLILLIKKANVDTYIVPDGNTELNNGDKLIIITHKENNRNILEKFGVGE